MASMPAREQKTQGPTPFPQVRSDQLPWLREFGARLSVVSRSPRDFVPYRAVVDANHIIAGIRFKVRLPRPPRVHWEELVPAGVLVVFAPTALLETVPRKLAEISVKQKLPLQPMLAIWEEMKPLIRIESPGDTSGPRWDELRARDPEDVDYCQLVEKLGADFLLSGDHHVRGLPFEVFAWEDANPRLGALKKYARTHAVELHTKASSNLSIMLTARGAAELVKAAARAPVWVKVVGAVGAFLLLRNEVLRAKTGKGVRALAIAAVQVLGELQQTGSKSEAEAFVHLASAQRGLPRRPPVRP